MRRLFAHWRFRADRPQFKPGDELRAYLTAFDPATGQGQMRIGDTVLSVDGAAAGQLDELVEVRIEQFDAARAVGRAVVRR